MLSRVIRLVLLYIVAVLVMVAGHLLFMACLPGIYGDIDLATRLDVVVAGLRMDCSIAGYLSILPALILIFSLWLIPRATDRLLKIYYIAASALTGALLTLDTILYSYWGIKLDTTPFFYFSSSPTLALASASVAEIAGGLGIWIAASAVIYLLFAGAMRLTPLSDPVRIHNRRSSLIVLVLLAAALFIPIRGGFTVATTNLSSAYFSTEARLNHAAVNPIFSLMYSATHASGFDKDMRFMDPAEAARIAAPLKAPASYQSTAADSLLTVDRPDIVLVILESFSSHLLPVQGGENIAPRLDSIARSSLLMTEVYASSFRTDRAIPAILSGLPAAPDEPVMKHTAIAERLPGLPAALARAGYRSTYYYGGDINFTNQRAYLRSAGIDSIVSDTDFPISQRISKWGVNDGFLFDRVVADERARTDDPASPRLTVVQTSSSHEPFDVGPFVRHSDPAANAFAYTDSCVGAFVDSLAASPRWERTLVILMPDHYGCYPSVPDERARHHIPLIMTGGALATRGTIATPAAQSDLAATLLAALGIPADEFPFSRDILATPAPRLAVFSEPDFAAGIEADGSMIRLPLTGSVPTDSSSRPLQAYLQELYTYLSSLSSQTAK